MMLLLLLLVVVLVVWGLLLLLLSSIRVPLSRYHICVFYFRNTVHIW